MVCIHLAQDREQGRALVNTVMNLWVAQNAGISLSKCATGVFSRTRLPWVTYLLWEDVAWIQIIGGLL
jgi:hypothetical protein